MTWNGLAARHGASRGEWLTASSRTVEATHFCAVATPRTNHLAVIRQWRITAIKQDVKVACMAIIETSIFTRQVQQLLSDDDYRGLQTALVNRPNSSSVIMGSGGLRKLRWAAKGKGKRGGSRLTY